MKTGIMKIGILEIGILEIGIPPGDLATAFGPSDAIMTRLPGDGVGTRADLRQAEGRSRLVGIGAPR